MRVKTSTELRKTLAATLDQVRADHMPVLITREGGKPPAVLISLEDCTSMEETTYLTKSPENRRRLLEAIAELDDGQGVERDLLKSPSRSIPSLGRTTCTGRSRTARFRRG
jgi:antitoxin YefM